MYTEPITYIIKTQILIFKFLFQTSDSKNAFLGATHYDITIHDPPKEDDVPLAFQKVGKVLVNHVEDHLQFSLPLDPINDTLKNSESHYEEGKKGKVLASKGIYLVLMNVKEIKKAFFNAQLMTVAGNILKVVNDMKIQMP